MEDKDKKPKIRFKGFTEAWEQRKVGDFAKESSLKGQTGTEALKLTVKLHCKGVEKASETLQGSENTQYYIRKVGQFIYGKQNFFNGAIGIVPEYLDGYESTKDVPAFDVDKTVDVRWFYHYVARPEIYKPQEALCTGTGSKRFHVDNFYEMEFLAPNIDEQKMLGQYFDNIDNLITLHQRKYDKLVCFKKSMLEKMFPKKNNNVPEIRFNKFTEAWEQRKLGDIVSYVSSNLSARDAQEQGLYDIYDANSVIGKTNTAPIPKEYITIIKDGAGVGRIRILPKNSLFIGTMGGLLANNSDLNFVYALLSRFSLGNEFSGSTIPHIYFKDYGNNEYYVPAFEEQKTIGAYFTKLDNLITLHQCKLDKLKNVKKSMLEKMFI